MRDQVESVLERNRTPFHIRDGVLYVTVDGIEAGLQLAKDIIYSTVDKKTILYLSGGNTPKPLYQAFAKEEKLRPGVVGMIDERYGEPLHEKSNERMVGETGLTRYLSLLDIPFYGMLRSIPVEKTAQRYDELIRSLQTVYPKSVGIFGVGSDGHTASIIPHRDDFHDPLFDKERQFDMVSWIDDTTGPYGKRVTQTFLALTHLDLMIVLIFGQDKKKTLEKIFGNGSEEEIPARFFRRLDVSPRVLFITDQTV
jgi:6-phosphogluconolactonase